jgi:hypothetical protein
MNVRTEGGSRRAAAIALAAAVLVLLPIASPASGGDRARTEGPASAGACATAAAGESGLDLDELRSTEGRWTQGGNGGCEGAPGSCG